MKTTLLLAPNGKASNLNEVQYKLVRTDAFKNWFGDWETLPETSSKVIDENGEPLVVYHGSKKDFFEFDKEKIKDSVKWGKAFYFTNDYEYAKSYANSLFSKEKNNEPRAFFVHITDVVDIHKNSSRTEYVVFNSYQIKLADGSNTTFDANSNDIRFDDGGNVSTNLIAPNGKPSNLNEVQYKLVRTEVFKDWFGDWETSPETSSKIIDENGEPLVVYHGRSSYFNEFSNKDAGKYTSDNGKLGFFFTNNYNLANDFTKNKWASNTSKPRKNANIIACFLKIINPELMDGRRFTMLGDPLEFKEYIISQKYDGIIIEPMSKEDLESWIRLFGTKGIQEFQSFQYVAFEPNQIKLADGSNTTFNTVSDDIRFDDGGNVSTNLIAPNGKPSNLSPVQYELVRTSEFKKWFGDWETSPLDSSKVIDENGEPLVVYHGTNRDFNVFDNKEIASGSGNTGHYGEGFYFSFELLEAKTYTDRDNPKILNCFLNIRNPFDAFNLNHLERYADEFGFEKKNVAVDSDWMKEQLKSKDLIAYKLYCLVLENGYEKGWELFLQDYPDGYYNAEVQSKFDLNDISHIATEWSSKDSDTEIPEYIIEDLESYFSIEPKLITNYTTGEEPRMLFMTDYGQNANYITELIKKDGFDGIVAGSEIILFEPNQIKVADGTNTTFNADSDDIRFEEGGKMSNLLAPNGNPSNLNEVQYKLVRTPEFKNWFGDWEHSPETSSKVIDENGEPLVVYHGTNSNFTVFNKSFWQNRYFFTSDFQMSNSYGSKNMALFLSIKNPLEINNDGSEFAETFENDDLTKSNDGVIYNGITEKGEKVNAIIAFESNQIKLADGTNTTFNADSDDIRFEEGGKISNLLAPNGNPSNLNLVQYNLVRTPELKKWFGDWERYPKKSSLIVDENGEPKVMYHGTGNEDWAEYDLSSERESNSRAGGSWGKGIYLTSSKEEAKKYSKNGKVLEFFCLAKTQKKYDQPLKKADKKTIETAKELVRSEIEKSDYPDKEYAIKKYLFDLEYDLKKGKIPFLSGFITGDIYRQIMMSLGYDSVQDGTSHLVLYDSKQIKLADGTNTTFDMNSSNIRFDKGGSLTNKSKRLQMFYMTNNPSVDLVLKHVQPLIEELIVKQKELYFNEFDIEMTEFAVEIYEIGLIYNMVNALNKYLKVSDKITNFNLTRHLGKFEIQATVLRDDKPYNFYTELISAGGYNIQEYHYRYITKTDLPNSLENTAVENLKAKLSTIKKINNIDTEIERLKNVIDRENTKISQGYEMMNNRQYPLDQKRKDYIKNYIKSLEKIIEKFKVKKNNLESVFSSLSSKKTGANFGAIVKQSIGKKFLDRLHSKQYNETGDELKFKTETQSITKNDGNGNFKIISEFNTIKVTDLGNEKVDLEIGFDFRKKYQVVNEFKNIELKEIAVKINDLLGGSLSKYLEKGGNVNNDLLAPNGITSNLNETQYKLVRTQAFKDWFGDWENSPETSSKVVDENGEPLVVYHGSDDDFNKFIPNKNVFTRQQGFYFSSNENVSKKYGNIVKSYFINLKDVITYDADDSSFSEVIEEFPELENDLMQQGFAVDGVIINNVYDAPHGNKIGEKANTYCVYDSHNIKLANGKNTTFDSSNEDIRYEEGGSIIKTDMKENEEIVTIDKLKNTPAGGVLLGKSKEGQTIIPEDGTMGGFLAGNLHKEGGIKAINKSNGQPLEMQGNEVVITAPAVADQSKREFEGQMMTNRQILSKINSDGGGVSFADGGEIPAKIHTTNNTYYDFDGKMKDPIEIAHQLGCNSTLKNGNQMFTYNDTVYDVAGIYDAIANNKIESNVMVVATFPMKYEIYDKHYSKNIASYSDEPQGLMVLLENGEEVLIDGNHRMNNAYLNGLNEIYVNYVSIDAISDFIKKTCFAEGGHSSKNKSLEEIAKMHDVSLFHIMQQLAMGLEVEKEHTSDENERIRIAKDHLVENPDYYTILDKAGLEKGGNVKEFKYGGAVTDEDKSFDEITEKIKSELEKRGLLDHLQYVSKSITDYGQSWYLKFRIPNKEYNADEDLQIRISDHSVTSMNRILDTKYFSFINVFDDFSEEDAVKIVDGYLNRLKGIEDKKQKRTDAENKFANRKQYIKDKSINFLEKIKSEGKAIFVHGHTRLSEDEILKRNPTAEFIFQFPSSMGGFEYYWVNTNNGFGKLYLEPNYFNFLVESGVIDAEIVPEKITYNNGGNISDDYKEGTLLVLDNSDEYQEKIFRIVKIDDKQVELSVLEYGKEKDTYLLPISNLVNFRKASEEEIDFYNKAKENEKNNSEFANGGTVDLIKASKKGDTPARDLNNYNDVIDLQEDGIVGNHQDFSNTDASSVGIAFADGGAIDDKIMTISDLSDESLKLYDRVSNTRDSEIHDNNRYHTFLGISVYSTKEDRGKVFVEGVDRVFKTEDEADNYIYDNDDVLINESKIPFWIGTEKRYYELNPNKKGIYDKGGNIESNAFRQSIEEGEENFEKLYAENQEKEAIIKKIIKDKYNQNFEARYVGIYSSDGWFGEAKHLWNTPLNKLRERLKKEDDNQNTKVINQNILEVGDKWSFKTNDETIYTVKKVYNDGDIEVFDQDGYSNVFRKDDLTNIVKFIITKGYFIVDSENTAYEYAKMINDYFNVFNAIKNEQDLENFKKLQVPWFGTYENQTILHQIERYEKIGLPLGSNEVVRNNFKKAVAKIISNKMEEPLNYKQPLNEEVASKRQKSFESEGSKEGKGKLYEFFTPQIVADKMVALAQHYGFTGGNVLEPACGNGRLIKNLKDCNITAFEISKENYKMLESEFPNADLHNYNFEKAFLKAPRFNALLNRKGTETWLKNAPFDLVIANPPYGKFSGLYASYFNFKGQVEHFFILQSLYLLKKGGLGVFLIPSSFLRNGIAYNEIKQKMFEEAEFVDAYRMPSNLFEKTDIGTDILILRKK